MSNPSDQKYTNSINMLALTAAAAVALGLAGCAAAAESQQGLVQRMDPEAAPQVEAKAAAPTLPAGFVVIKAGRFIMGSPPEEAGRNEDEVAHPVTLTRDFALQATEVTQGQWEALMGNKPSRFAQCGHTCPVERVSRLEAMLYANRLSEREGLKACYRLRGCVGEAGGGCEGNTQQCQGDFVCQRVEFSGLGCQGYRLPTEAEWEFAARAGVDGPNHVGALEIRGDRDAPSMDPFAWYGGNSGVDYEGGEACGDWPERQEPAATCGTHSTSRKAPSPTGLSDIHGNVWEWVQDQYGDFTAEAATDPIGVEDPTYGIVRGGSWSSGGRHLRAAHRFGGEATWRFHQVGFRLARTWPLAAPTQPARAPN